MLNISKRTVGLQLAIAAALLLATAATSRAESRPIYAEGHCDLCACYEGGELHLHYHFHGTGAGADENGNPLVGEYGASELYTRVSDATKFTMSADARFSFLGAEAGDDVWALSQSGAAGQPYLGFGTEELDDEQWPTGVVYALKSVNGPGEFSMWTTDKLGAPTVYWATSDGITASDVYAMSALGHSHVNWGFTAEGVYEVEMQLSGTPAGGSKLYSEVETFTFLVGSSTVPEPSAIAMLLSAGAIAAFGLWRRRWNRK